LPASLNLRSGKQVEKLRKKKSNLEKLLGDPFKWDAWTVTITFVWQRVLVKIKEGRFATPVEVLLTSSKDELLAHVRLKTFERSGLEHLQSDESKWQSPEIYPVTAHVSDSAGVEEEWEVDPRPTTVN
jgi:hypothetical protein